MRKKKFFPFVSRSEETKEEDGEDDEIGDFSPLEIEPDQLEQPDDEQPDASENPSEGEARDKRKTLVLCLPRVVVSDAMLQEAKRLYPVDEVVADEINQDDRRDG